MKYRYLLSVAIVVIGLLSHPCLSQTVTAGSTGTFPTLAAAIDSFRSGGSNESNPDLNVINLLDASYDEQLPNADVQLTINAASGGSTILLQQQSGDTDGWDLDPPAGELVELNDLIILPSATSTPADDLLELGPSGTGRVILNRCLISSNWSGGPASVDGLTIPGPPTTATAQMGDNGINIVGLGARVGLNECIVTGLGGPGSTPDNILASGGSIVSVTSCVISHSQRIGIQHNNSATILTITGTQNKPTIFYRNGYMGAITRAEAGVFAFGGGPLSIDHTIFAYNNDNGIGVDDDGPTWSSCSISYTAFAYNGQGAEDTDLAEEAGLNVGNGGTANIRLDHCTFIGHNAPAIYATTLTNPMSATDTIIAGNVGSGTAVFFASGGGGTVMLNYCAVIQSGGNALGATYEGPGTVLENNVISDDPQFISTTLFSGSAVDLDYLDIGNFAYGLAGAGALPLTGYGDYAAGPTPTPTITPIVAGTSGIWRDYR